MIRIFTLNIGEDLLKFPKGVETQPYFLNIDKPLIWVYDEDKLLKRFIGNDAKQVYDRAYSYIEELRGRKASS